MIGLLFGCRSFPAVRSVWFSATGRDRPSSRALSRPGSTASQGRGLRSRRGEQCIEANPLTLAMGPHAEAQKEFTPC